MSHNDIVIPRLPPSVVAILKRRLTISGGRSIQPPTQGKYCQILSQYRWHGTLSQEPKGLLLPFTEDQPPGYLCRSREISDLSLSRTCHHTPPNEWSVLHFFEWERIFKFVRDFVWGLHHVLPVFHQMGCAISNLHWNGCGNEKQKLAVALTSKKLFLRPFPSTQEYGRVICD